MGELPAGLQGGYSDEAKRCSDTIRLMILLGKSGYWAAIRLSDGGGDGVAYGTRKDAIRHQLHESQCAYICIPPDDMSPKAAEAFLRINRDLYDKGFRLTDPDDLPEGYSPMMPQQSR